MDGGRAAGTLSPAAYTRRILLAAPARFTLPELALARAGLILGASTTSRCATTYYDSADLVLAGYEIVVRRRGEGGWTLDLPSGQERTFAQADGAVPTPLRDLLHTQLRSRALLPVVCVSSQRTTLEVCTHARAPVALVMHDDVRAYRETEELSPFGTVELAGFVDDAEAVSAVQRLTEVLIAAGCTRTSPAQQLRRAFGILSPPGPVPHRAAPVAPRTAPLRDFLTPVLGASVERLLAHDVGVRVDRDIEDVHQLRVATRRLRADLRALRSVLARREVSWLRAELGWLGSLAGPVRDADVLLVRLSAALADLSGDDATGGVNLLARLTSERADDRVALIAGMREPRYDALLDALAEVVTRPHLLNSRKARCPASAVLARATIRQWDALLEAVAGLGMSASITQLHQVRIAAKRLRYTAETAQLAVGKPAARLASRATRIQSTLGDLHDSVNAALWLRNAAADDSSVSAVAERLAADEDAASERLRAGWQQLWTKTRSRARADIDALAKRASARA